MNRTLDLPNIRISIETDSCQIFFLPILARFKYGLCEDLAYLCGVGFLLSLSVPFIPLQFQGYPTDIFKQNTLKKFNQSTLTSAVFRLYLSRNPKQNVLHSTTPYGVGLIGQVRFWRVGVRPRPKTYVRVEKLDR